MSEEKKTPETENLPAFVKAAPELLPLWDWWVKEGKSTLLMLAVVALAVAGVYGYRNSQRKAALAANAPLMQAQTAEDLEAAVASYGSTKLGPALRVRQAKAYYDADRYEDALKVYEELCANAAGNAAFADIAAVGRAQTLEALDRAEEAKQAFEAYAQANTNSYLLLTAKLGAARCKALLGDKDGAVKDLEALKTAAKDEEKPFVDRTIDVVKRHDPARMVKPSLFDVANAAETAAAADKAPAAPAAPAPAPAAPAAAPATPAPAAVPAAPAPAAAPAAPAPAPAPAPAAK